MRDLPAGCPECPLTRARGQLYTGWTGGSFGRDGYPGLYHDWTYFYGASFAEFTRDEPGLASAFVVTLARVALAGKDRVDPAWSPETAALVAAYRGECAYVRRESEWALRQHLKKPPKGG